MSGEKAPVSVIITAMPQGTLPHKPTVSHDPFAPPTESHDGGAASAQTTERATAPTVSSAMTKSSTPITKHLRVKKSMEDKTKRRQQLLKARADRVRKRAEVTLSNAVNV